MVPRLSLTRLVAFCDLQGKFFSLPVLWITIESLWIAESVAAWTGM